MVKALVRTNVTDPVADMLSRIRNANVAYKDDLLVPASKLNQAILKILAAEGFVDGFETEGEGVHQALRVRLKYGAKRERTITGVVGLIDNTALWWLSVPETPRAELTAWLTKQVWLLIDSAVRDQGLDMDPDDMLPTPQPAG